MIERLDRVLLPEGLLLPGLLLPLSPWLLGFAEAAAPSLSAILLGTVLLLLCGAAAETPGIAIRGAVAVGAWTLAMPLLLGFLELPSALAAHASAGLLAMAVGVRGADLAARGSGDRAMAERGRFDTPPAPTLIGH